MDRSWTNYCMSAYLKSIDGGSNLNLVNNGWSFKPKAYVNPKLVNCIYPFGKVNNATVSNKIHINPNFKLPYYQSASQPKSEVSSLHINPHFCPKNTNFNIASQQISHNLPQTNTSPFVEQKNNKKLVRVPQKKKQDVSEKGSSTMCYTPEKFQSYTNTSNSAYFWSKQNASSASSKNVPTSCEESKTETNRNTVATKCVPFYSSSIKTRCKIVNRVSCPQIIHKLNHTVNFKFPHKNPYKIVNVEKSRLEENIKSPSTVYSAPNKRNLSEYSRFSVVNNNDKKPALDLRKFHAAGKVKVSNNNQTSYVNKITNLIRTKYMYLNKRKQVKLLNTGKYKLDKRKKNVMFKRNAIAADTCDGSMSFPKSRCASKDKVWKSMFWKVNKFNRVNSLVWRREGSFEKDLQRVGKSYPNKTVVNIGGIMYKSTVNKLTRTKNKKQSSHHFNAKPILRPCKINQVVYVRGEKFLLGEGGKTLIRQLKSGDSGDTKKFSVKRVDIGGVTYIQKTSNILIQTKSHQARNFVNYAKQKSIALLSNLHKRCNKPCMIYQKFGICRRHTRGMCIYVHDPKNIALCKKFLKGDCKGSDCHLSHDIVKEKVATCHFFLKGNCHRENCPFLHVKVNKKAAICVDFLQGFCTLGQNCKKRHIHQCPDYDENESCSRGIKCPYPHRKITKRKMKDGKTYKVSKFKLTENLVNKEGEEEKKVEKKIKKRGKKKAKTVKGKTATDNCPSQETCNDSTTIECIPKRVKLDNLPLFIPLNT